ncbi:MAG TPA: hypothetical protein V6D19_03005 [Stenomitos sp.]
MAFQIATQLYLDQPVANAPIGKQFLQILERSTDPQWVAIALAGLAKNNPQPVQLQRWRGRVQQRFPNWSQIPVLVPTLEDLNERLSPSPISPLYDLLKWSAAPGQMQMYVPCPRDRTQLGVAILKDRNGQFVRTTNRAVPLLLRSIHGLSWNFTRGETPQGLYCIEGLIPQPDTLFFRAYGQFSLVNLFVPFESGVRSFLPGRPGPFQGSLSDYQLTALTLLCRTTKDRLLLP